MVVGFIGLGNMGSPLARNIMEAGEKLIVYGRTRSRLLPLLSAGAEEAEKLEDLAECDVLCTCLPMPSDVLGVALGEGGLYGRMKAGAVHVEFSTIDPATAGKLAAA
ncbi:MAG: NAD(P)-binding domain-containing protein, partial [Mailhella sp.]